MSTVDITTFKAHADELIAKAIAALTPFGPRAAALEGLARYVIERDR